MLRNKLANIAKYAFSELTKPNSFVKGEAFEQYVRTVLFPSQSYELMHRTADYHTNKDDYVASSLEPDFTFACRKTGRMFRVEAKFRKGWMREGKLEWCRADQLKRYQDIDRNSGPVLLVLGVGDRPGQPDEVFLIPIKKAKFTGFYDSFLDEHTFHPDKSVFPSHLWKLLA